MDNDGMADTPATAATPERQVIAIQGPVHHWIEPWYLACDLITSPRWRRVFNAGARPQRLLFASKGTKDPKASDVLYIKELAAPLTINTMPEGTLKAFASHGELGAMVPADGGDCETVLAQFAKAGVDCDALAKRKQIQSSCPFTERPRE